MRFTSALISSFLFASAVLALRFPEPQLLDLVERFSDNDSALAGAVYNKVPGTFNSIAAGFRVPHISTPHNSSTIAMVSIDGLNTCSSAFLRSGVYLMVNDNNTASFIAFVHWAPADMILESVLAISAGDNIHFTLNVDTSGKSGTVNITNFSNGEFIDVEITSAYPLCGQDAEWLISRVLDNTQLKLPLPNFGKVTFIGAMASGPGVELRPQQGAEIIDIVDDGRVRTWTSFGTEDALTIHYIP